MIKRFYIKCLILFAQPIALSHQSFADDSIANRANMVTSKLQVLNRLGMVCDASLEVSGLKALNTSDCKKYLDNMNGDYFKGIMNECQSMLDWRAEKYKYFTENKAYYDKNPLEEKALAMDFMRVKDTCDVSSLEKYRYLSKPADTVQALKELK